MSNLKELIGESILRIDISEDETCLRFVSNTHYYIYQSSGDCCALIYFEDIEYPPDKPRNGYLIEKIEVVDEYGYRIKTRSGDIVISGRYDSGSGWEGYDVGCDLLAAIPIDYKGDIHTWKEFKEG